ncbi:hypothetical protein F990_03007 [Acinetobacter tjernbergiae DSM 14971 = CIP 107465]|uniref:Sel1 repeat family protein n=2 Tax=Acinetobacter tjernbergiae TaxID=202955 RepID=V2UZK8_9GAMM|nr:hypothetical protein F990_03007 [Acinetobacter tjernbergiae DSM 14971 = CIP 107465]
METDDLYLKCHNLIEDREYEEGLSILFEIKNNINAKFLLAYLYEIGVDGFLDKDTYKSILIYEELIELNQVNALYNLGMLYLRESDFNKSVFYLKMSSEVGNSSASYWLYRIYEENFINEAERQKYLMVSKNQGHLQAKKSYLIEKRIKSKSYIQKLKLSIQILYLKIKVIPIIIKDPKDERLV